MKWFCPTTNHLCLVVGMLVLCDCENAIVPTRKQSDTESLLVQFIDVEEEESDLAVEVIDAADTSIAASPGEKQFNSYCAACHQRGGQGEEGRVPPLDQSPWVAGSEDRLVRIVLHGLRGPIEIAGQTYNLEMPAFGMLFKDDDIAAILSYVRRRYGAPSPAITPEKISSVRNETQDRKRYWTVEELLQFPE